MIDCHCHLCATEFDQDLDVVIDKAKSTGVICCLVNTENVAEFSKAIDLSKKFKNWFVPCFGIHPVQYEKIDDDFIGRSATLSDVEEMEKYLELHHEQLVAIGEVGLDYTPRYLKGDQDKISQQNVLKKQIVFAEKYDLPLIAHSRSAGKYVISFMIENGARNVLLHAFSGNYKSALAGIQAGYYFSVPPSSILSDQERNEPANITYSAEFIAKLKNVDVETVKRITTENAHKLFPKLNALINK